jgi:mRNA degradation ribonuclease J1/J2
LEALLITHAHEDHVGAVPHHWPELRCPVYCTPFTAAILRGKLADAGLAGQVPLSVVEPGEVTRHGEFSVRWLPITHSTPESRALLIRSPAVAALRKRFEALGVRVIDADRHGRAVPLHASGHPARDDLRDLYDWVRPAIAVPVHGEALHLDAHASLAREAGVPSVLSPRNGDLVQLAPRPAVFRGRVAAGRVELDR